MSAADFAPASASNRADLGEHVRWIVRLRWAAVAGVAAAAIACRAGFAVIDDESAAVLLAGATILAICNALLAAMPPERLACVSIALAQVLLDLGLLTAMLHAAGGLRNPFLFFYVFHIVIAGILLRPRDAYAVTAVACALVASSALLNETGLLPARPLRIAGALGEAGPLGRVTVAGVLAAFTATAACTAYFTTSIMEKSRRRGAEIREAGIQLVQAEKMAAVGQLAAGVAHEINNPLAVIASSAEILADAARPGAGTPLAEEARARHLAKIEENVYRCKAIIESLLDFSRKDGGAGQTVDLPRLLDEAIRLVEGSARARRREIERAYAAEAEAGRFTLTGGTPQQLQQVVLNLLLNALDAAPEGGRVTVSADRANGAVTVSVADTGPGIEPRHRDRLFEPFFTTKPPGKGTGLGLYVSRRIVESLGGSIAVESSPGNGATFRVTIPAGGGRA